VFPSSESLRSSSVSRAVRGRLSLIDERGVAINVFLRDGAPPASARDQRRHPHMSVVVYREGIPDLLVVIALAVNAIRDMPGGPAVSAAGWGGG
jgi:hypothetical protein